MARKKQELKLAVIDAETDPFLYGRIPKPFSWGFFDGEIYKSFWGDDCTEQLIEYLKTREPLMIYAHNGGKFDFFFLLDYLCNPIRIINGRIVSCNLFGHTLRDSYAIMPVSLIGITGGKLEIDYRKMEIGLREKHKEEILKYLRVDCEELLKAVTKFVDKFGPQLTIGATAFKRLQFHHRTANTSKAFDETYRKFYFGGRCQALKTGALIGNYEVFDVNSMYPAVMSDFLHPNGSEYIILENCTNEIDGKGSLRRFNKRWPYFIKWRGINNNAVPCRITEGPNKGGLNFEEKAGVFFSTSHEIRIALKYKRIKIDEILELHIPIRTISFKEFVTECIDEKIRCEKLGDLIGRLFAKLLANSGYGKFAQNPENYSEWYLARDSSEAYDAKEQGYELHEIFGEVSIWRKPVLNCDRFNNVAIAASITGASRAVLLEALCNSIDPVYCDTDSIICKSLKNVEIDKYKLGAWKSEGALDEVYIAGKKLYAGYKNGECVKLATKGVRLTGENVKQIVKGGSIEWVNQAPSFRFGQAIEDTKFVKRTVKMRHC